MTSSVRTLVILDTNKIRNNFEWEKDYSNFEPKGDFIKIINWIEKNRLNDVVNIGLPEIVIEEIINNRSRNFKQQLENLKSGITKLEKIPEFDFSKISVPEHKFVYSDFIKNKIKEYVKNKTFILILKLEKKHYSKTLTLLMKKAVIKEKPFTDSGRGFQDALIWETIMNLKNIKTYSNVFLLSENQKDFDAILQEAFTKKFSKDLNVEGNTDTLLVTLENMYDLHIHNQNLLSYLKTEYFQSKLIELLSDSYDIKIKKFKIKEFLAIKEVTFKDLQEFELTETYSESDLSNLKKLNFYFKNSNKNFKAELIIEYATKEIAALDYEEVK